MLRTKNVERIDKRISHSKIWETKKKRTKTKNKTQIFSAIKSTSLNTPGEHLLEFKN